MVIALILSIIALLLCGVGIGMSIWSLTFVLKYLSWDKREDSSNSGDGTSDKG